jgi:hypothetical protein
VATDAFDCNCKPQVISLQRSNNKQQTVVSMQGMGGRQGSRQCVSSSKWLLSHCISATPFTNGFVIYHRPTRQQLQYVKRSQTITTKHKHTLHSSVAADAAESNCKQDDKRVADTTTNNSVQAIAGRQGSRHGVSRLSWQVPSLSSADYHWLSHSSQASSAAAIRV